MGSLTVAICLAGCGGAHHSSGAPPATTSTSSAGPAASPTWTSRDVPAGVGSLNDVACPSPTQCYAVGGGEFGSGPGFITGSSDGGESWHLQDKVAQGWFSAIACSTVTSCISVGGVSSPGGNSPATPLAVVTTDGGQRWTSTSLPPEVGAAGDVACGSSSLCVAVGSAVARSSDGGASWTEEPSPSGLASILSVTCPTSSFCMIGGVGPGPGASSPSVSSVSHDAGLTWSAASAAAGPAGLGAISCVSSESCVGLVGSDATNTYGAASPLVTSDGGATWTKGSSEVGASVSCVGAFCISVGASSPAGTSRPLGDAFVSNDGGRSWTRMVIATPDSLTAVACLSSTDCVAVGGNYPGNTAGAVMTYR
jgi:hypothetical protein